MPLVIGVLCALPIRLTFAQQVLSAGRVPLARPPLKRADSPHPAAVGGLILRLSTETDKQMSLKNGNQPESCLGEAKHAVHVNVKGFGKVNNCLPP